MKTTFLFLLVFIFFCSCTTTEENDNYLEEYADYVANIDWNLYKEIEKVVITGGVFNNVSISGNCSGIGINNQNISNGYSFTMSADFVVDDFVVSKNKISTAQYCYFLNQSDYEVIYGDFPKFKIIFDKEHSLSIVNSAEPINLIYILYKDKTFFPVPGFENYPVHVNWFAANEFCKWVGGKLPTMKQWEYIALNGYPNEGYFCTLNFEIPYVIGDETNFNKYLLNKFSNKPLFQNIYGCNDILLLPYEFVLDCFKNYDKNYSNVISFFEDIPRPTKTQNRQFCMEKSNPDLDKLTYRGDSIRNYILSKTGEYHICKSIWDSELLEIWFGREMDDFPMGFRVCFSN